MSQDKPPFDPSNPTVPPSERETRKVSGVGGRPGTSPYYDQDAAPTLEVAPLEDEDFDSPEGSRGLEQRILEKMAQHDASARVRQDPLIGTLVANRFEIISKIGAGGMGVVYRARQRGMDRNVAIKILTKQGSQNETAVRRFQREALAVSKLEHPNTVRIYDFGEMPDGTPYIAMEFLTGAPLERILHHERQLPVRRTLRVILQICRSLDEAHAKGIVHRDLKPDNVFVGAVEGQADYVKVLDFGVAKLREGGNEGGTLTQHGTIFGTPKYMSPEQCKSQEVDARSDLYSVGVLMYEMLAGRVPFESDNPLSILIMHTHDPVAALGDVRPDLVIPFECEELLHRLLEKDADARPQSAKDVISAVEDLLNRVPDEFEQVITYESATQVGLKVDRSQAYTVPDAQLRTQAIANLRRGDSATERATLAGGKLPPLKVPAWKKVLFAGVGLTAAAGATIAVIMSQLAPLPANARQALPAEVWGEGQLPKLVPDLVTVTVRANVAGVTVRDAGTGALLGQIDEAGKAAPLPQWLREPGRTVKLRLDRVGAASVEYAVDLGKDQDLGTATFTVDTKREVKLTLTTNAPEVMVALGTGGQMFRTPATAGAPLTIPLAQGTAPLSLTFEKAGYVKATREVTPSADVALNVTLDEVPKPATPEKPIDKPVVVDKPVRPNRPTAPTGQVTPQKPADKPVDPGIKLTPVRDPPKTDSLKIGPIKDFK